VSFAAFDSQSVFLGIDLKIWIFTKLVAFLGWESERKKKVVGSGVGSSVHKAMGAFGTLLVQDAWIKHQAVEVGIYPDARF